jgi:predicted RNA binding protein YcfA (HicA-like mRNA interferase family)
MSKVPQVTGKEAVRAFERADFRVARIKGSHHIMKKKGHRLHLSVPVHDGETLGKGLLNDLIATAGLSLDEFIKLL